MWVILTAGTVTRVVDAQFSDARLAPLYDTFDGARGDLPAYLRLIRELGARTLLDVGCGTGTFAILAAAMGVEVTGVDPANASIEVASHKAGSERVTWWATDAADAPEGPFDLVTMTGNVAQVFLDDDEWVCVLAELRRRLVPSGRLVFETRRPEAKAWQEWSHPYEASSTFPGIGVVRQTRHLLRVELPFVSFRWRYTFPDGGVLDSDSTLRFRTDEQNQAALRAAGFTLIDIRQAADRPDLERVYIAAPNPQRP